MIGRCGSRFSLARFRRPDRPPSKAAIVGGAAASRSVLAVGVLASLVLLPLVWVQGSVTRRRIARLPAASAPHRGDVPGRGRPIRVLAIGESSISGVGISRGDESVTAMAARELARRTGRRVVWRAYGLSGATARQALEQLLPSIAVEPVDLVFVAFGVNDATGYRSPAAYSNDLAALITAIRDRVGEAAVVALQEKVGNKEWHRGFDRRTELSYAHEC